ncbi:MAG: hypothetical protein HWE16_06070 [Gammaproteobacteria bacterium]|nr:hypothetical protein [Gammaproteobacteria bacterium]
MTNIINSDDSDLNEINTLETNDRALDFYYRLHKKINSKNEEISKTYKNNILVNFSDVEELDAKVMQSIKSLGAINESISIRILVTHCEGEAEKFNSFMDFKNHNSTSPYPTTEVGLMYQFSCFDDSTNKTEMYKVTANIKSRIGELKEIENSAPPFISTAILSGFVTPTARIKVEYSDYVKARHFIAMFDEWIKGCHESIQIPFINILKKYSHMIANIGQLVIVGLLGWFVAQSIEKEMITEESWVKFLIIYLSIFYLVIKLSQMILRKLELSIDSYMSVSYLKINKGDDKLIKEFEARNKKSLKWSVFGLLGAIGLGIFANASYDFIKYLLA